MLGLVRLSCSLACRLFFERDPDLRDRVVGSVAAGRSCRATAALFGVSVARVVKWCQRWRATGSQAWGRRRDRDLTEASRFPASWVSDSRCWLGLGASIDGETLFEANWKAPLLPAGLPLFGSCCEASGHEIRDAHYGDHISIVEGLLFGILVAGPDVVLFGGE